MGKARKATRTSRRSSATGNVVAPRRLAPKRRAGLFQAFVSTETPTAKTIELIRRGVAAGVVDDMAEYLGVPKTVIFGILHTPESTAHKLIKDHRTLDSAASERVVRVAEITRRAEHTFGREAAAQWLKSPNLALRGSTPLSVLDTEPGAGEVRKILSSIDYGGTF